MTKLKLTSRYVIYTYLLFWVMVLGICGMASMVFHVSPIVMRWLSNLCAWSPTIVLFAMFKKLMPGITVKEFYKKAFSGKIRIHIMLLVPIVIVGGMLVSVFILSLIERKAFSSFWSMGAYSLPLTILLSLLSGPTGEESGWRGYLRCELEKKYDFFRASVYLGVIWAFWHTVLWFVDSDFVGGEMLIYVISNVVVMTALTIIMNVIMRKYDNLLYAVWVHFCFNFTYGFINADIWFYAVMSIVYVIIAGVFFCLSKRDKSYEKINII